MSFSTYFPQLARKVFSRDDHSSIESPEFQRPNSAEGIIRKKKVASSQNKDLLYFDLFYQISYMAAVSTAGISRDRIFEYSAELPGKAAGYFQEIQRMSRNLGYDYAEACRLEGESVEDDMIRSLLLRMSGSMSSGESEAEFLGREADVLGVKYSDEYERKLESLKQWTDAYSALIISAVLVIIIGVVSTMIWKTNTVFILALVGLTIGITITGSWLIMLMSPKETVTLRKPSSREQKITRMLLTILLPVAIVVALLLLGSGMGTGWTMLAFALLVLPIGYASVIDDTKISGRDQEIGTFLRSLGGVATAIGTTVSEALTKMDIRSIPSLSEEANRLNIRLQIGILSSLCWKRFVLETGSVAVNRSVGMFRDAMALGADAEDAGNRASSYAVRLGLLRARRKLITRPFAWLTFVMHAAVILLLVFVTEVMMTFGQLIMNIEKDIPGAATSSPVGGYFSFNFAGLELLNTLVFPVILVLTVVNAITPKIADGGHKCKFLYNLSITMGISGICLLVVPRLTHMIFGGVA